MPETDVRCGSIATEMGCPPDVRFTPDGDRIADMISEECPEADSSYDPAPGHHASGIDGI